MQFRIGRMELGSKYALVLFSIYAYLLVELYVTQSPGSHILLFIAGSPLIWIDFRILVGEIRRFKETDFFIHVSLLLANAYLCGYALAAVHRWFAELMGLTERDEGDHRQEAQKDDQPARSPSEGG